MTDCLPEPLRQFDSIQLESWRGHLTEQCSMDVRLEKLHNRGELKCGPVLVLRSSWLLLSSGGGPIAGVIARFATLSF